MAATIKDVAKMAGVSISTVSRVINDSKPVSPDARRRVLEAVKALEYEPNEVARSLVTKKSNLIGVIVNDIGQSSISQSLRGIEEIGRMYNYDILLVSSYGSKESEIKYVKLLQQKQVEGIIVISEIYNEVLLETLKGLKIPYVYLNRYYTVKDIPTVSVNNRESSMDMTNYLLRMGHEKIAYVTYLRGEKDNLENYKIEGYKKVMEQNKLSSNILTLSDLSEEAYLDLVTQIEERIRAKEITALFVYNDDCAIRLINLLLDDGFDVPEDISVVGFGDNQMSAVFRPKLTTVKEPFYDYGAVAIRRLLKEINKEPKDDAKIFLPSRIVERQTVKKLK
ncbi:MAG: LacI family DNA-binding transcriptional regulator [Tissierellia bacterium]|nr:LacI family DNA-binding transcriptional regulator [Tissierellia bacterium]